MASPVIQTQGSQVVDGLSELDPTCRHGLFLIAMRSLGNEDDARDAVQEILARALEAIRGDRIPPEVPVPRFVQGIARHVLCDTVRQRIRHQSDAGDATDLLPANDPSALDRIVAIEERESLRIALNRLRGADRELLRLCYVDGRSLADIAKELGVSSERIRKKKSRALERLRALLSPRRHVSPPHATDKA
jgi:RNA polymerase sigma-70 factor (ECF subfamily)